VLGGEAVEEAQQDLGGEEVVQEEEVEGGDRHCPSKKTVLPRAGIVEGVPPEALSAPILLGGYQYLGHLE
jgi:hypothetical protein